MTMKQLEGYCDAYRKGKISEDQFRLKLVAFGASCAKLHLQFAAERLGQGTQTGGDGE